MQPSTASNPLDILIVGAGFSGMYLLHRLRNLRFNVCVVDAAPEVGGTWWHNRYPGLRCDVESLEYQYSWSDELRREWRWSERFSAQPEILAYAKFVADKLDLRRDIQFNARVERAVWNDDTHTWSVSLSDGSSATARHVVFATGALATPRMPDIPGVENYKGWIVHTAEWPMEGVDFTGMSVGLIGTGSSGLQVAPQIAKQAKKLHIFQRSPAYSIPARNRALSEEDYTRFFDNIDEFDSLAMAQKGGIVVANPTLGVQDVSPEERERMLGERWADGGAFTFLSTFKDVQMNETSNQLVADFVRERIRETVADPALAEKLCPKYLIATRRTCVDIGYYEIFNRDNVELVDVSEDKISAFTEAGVRLASGREYALDAIVLATGYDAMTGALLAVDVVGRDGLTAKTAWENGPRNLLGLMIAGFPNMFTVTGPGSPSVLANVIRAIEHHVDWLSNCFDYLRRENIACIEADEHAQDAWVQHVNQLADRTLFPRTPSWYIGADIPGKPKVFMPYAGGLPAYREHADRVAQNGYEGFRLTREKSVAAT
ncbi:MAG: NAD(P)/FAD-dependent oxidoreductase [Rhodoblastus sp.]|nr:NAD(P)/FAD-dependent oxidoreductase [Rhodoblastus sp.]